MKSEKRLGISNPEGFQNPQGLMLKSEKELHINSS